MEERVLPEKLKPLTKHFIFPSFTLDPLLGSTGKKKIGHSFPIYLTPTDQGGGRLGRDPHSVYLE
jgi:hypothetical protein